MTDFLTTLPWGWYAGGLVLAVALVYGAAYYEAVKTPAEYHAYCAQVDQDIERQEALVEDRIAQIDMEQEFVSEIEVWLKARDVYEAGS